MANQGIIASSMIRVPSVVEEQSCLVERIEAARKAPGKIQGLYGVADADVIRNSVATYIDSNGIIQTAQPNEPRFQDGKILVEGESTNLNPWGTDPTMYIGVNALTLVPSNEYPPSSFNSVSGKVFETIEHNRHRIVYRLPQIEDELYTISLFAKPINHKWLQINPTSGASTEEWANFNIEDAIVGNTGAITSSENRAKIVNLGNGWVRCEFTFKSLVTEIRYPCILATNNINSQRYPQYTGESTDPLFYIWGLQFEQKIRATSYIPTNGQIATRLRDEITIVPPQDTDYILRTTDGVEMPRITNIPPVYELPEGMHDKIEFFSQNCEGILTDSREVKTDSIQIKTDEK